MKLFLKLSYNIFKYFMIIVIIFFFKKKFHCYMHFAKLLEIGFFKLESWKMGVRVFWGKEKCLRGDLLIIEGGHERTHSG